MKPIYFLMIFMLFFSCKKETKIASEFDENLQLTDLQIPEVDFESDDHSVIWVDEFAEKTGVEKRATAEIHFQKGEEKFSISRNCGWYEIRKSTNKNEKVVLLEMDNTGLRYFIDGEEQELTVSETSKQLKALKNELFLLEFPFNLRSQTVQKKYLDAEKIAENSYHRIQFAFVEDQVTVPYLTQGIIWINQTSNLPEFVALDFDGYLEFRKITGWKEKEGIRFFEYELYKAKTGVQDLNGLAEVVQNQSLNLISQENYKNIEIVLGASSCD